MVCPVVEDVCRGLSLRLRQDSGVWASWTARLTPFSLISKSSDTPGLHRHINEGCVAPDHPEGIYWLCPACFARLWPLGSVMAAVPDKSCKHRASCWLLPAHLWEQPKPAVILNSPPLGRASRPVMSREMAELSHHLLRKPARFLQTLSRAFFCFLFRLGEGFLWLWVSPHLFRWAFSTTSSTASASSQIMP